jgi:hypothetical protein
MTRGVWLLALLSFMLCLLAAGEAFAAPQAKKPTLYVDQIDEGKAEIFVTYSYQTGFPPDPEDVLQVASARCSDWATPTQ